MNTGTPSLYANIEAEHNCDIPPEHKRLVGTVMEDGRICMLIQRTTDSAILEHIYIGRDDFNRWMHNMRQWWNDEKAHPLAGGRTAR